VRLLLTALRCEKGDLEGNLARHLGVLEKAAASGCDLAVFPEMSLTGSVEPRTHPERLIDLDHAAVARLTAATERDPAALFGVAERNGPHITQVLAAGGAIVGVYRKRHLGEGEEAYRPGSEGAALTLAGGRLGVAICAEGAVALPWNEAAAAGARVVCFCAAPGLDPPRCTDEEGWRRGFGWWEPHSLGQVSGHARRLGVWVAMSGQAGATVDEDFPGLAALVDPTGAVVARLPDWREGTLVVEVPDRDDRPLHNRY
jgi:predicted amidohydrolase